MRSMITKLYFPSKRFFAAQTTADLIQLPNIEQLFTDQQNQSPASLYIFFKKIYDNCIREHGCNY